MRKRVLPAICIIASSFSFSGCPAGGGGDIALGIWLVELQGFNNYLCFKILPGGIVDSLDPMMLPVGAGNVFTDDMTWEQNGNIVTMIQLDGNTKITILATLQNSTFMTGTRTVSNNPNNPVAMTATKAPSERLQQN